MGKRKKDLALREIVDGAKALLRAEISPDPRSIAAIEAAQAVICEDLGGHEFFLVCEEAGKVVDEKWDDGVGPSLGSRAAWYASIAVSHLATAEKLIRRAEKVGRARGLLAGALDI